MSYGKRVLSLLMVVLLVLGTVAGCGKSNQTAREQKPAEKGPDTIKIGFVGPLTGPTATFGVGSKQGVEFATERINTAGGINGKKVDVVYLDDKGDPQESVLAVRRLIEMEKAVAIVGGSTSTATAATKDLINKSEIPAVAPYATDPKITDDSNKYVFVNAANNVLLGSYIGKYAVEDLKLKKLAAMVRDDDYGRSIFESFKKQVTSAGVAVVAEEHYSTDAKDFKALLVKITNAKPDGLLLSGYYAESGLIAKQVRELGLNVKLLGTNPLMSPGYVEVGGAGTEGTALTALYFPDKAEAFGGQLAEQFVKDWKQKYNNAPNIYAAHAYDAANLIFEAVKKAGPNPKAIRDQLASVKGYAGVTGETTFTKNGSVLKPIIIVEFKQGKLNFVKYFAAK